MTRKSAAYVLVGAAIVAFGALSAVIVDALRLPLTVACCLLLPGLGWARKAGRADAMDTVALAVLISMSATILVSTAMVVTNSWSTPGGVAVLVAFAVLGFVPFDRARSKSGAHR